MWRGLAAVFGRLRARLFAPATGGPGPASAGGGPPGVGGVDRPDCRGRSPLGDQVELRWRIGSEIALIRTEYLYGVAAAQWRPAATKLLPWLEYAHAWLALPRSVAELDQLAAAWRARRAGFLPPAYATNDWAELILVEHVPRQKTGRWWRLRHGNQPPPPR